jgi:CTP:molybdopterin cytidylyltransferase MocA
MTGRGVLGEKRRLDVRAVITAGGTVDGAFAEAIGTPVKALAPFGARTLLDVVLDACEAAGIDGVAVVGGREIRAHLRGRDVRIIDDTGDGSRNVLRALEAWPSERFLYLTSDLPFVDANAIVDLAQRSDGAALTMGLCSGDAYDGRFPDAPPHGVVLRGERIVNACAFVVAPAAVEPVRSFATRFFAARKSLAALALLLGPVLCARFALRRLGVAEIERHARHTLGIPVAAIRDCDPGLCYDVDSLDEYAYACARSA